MMSQKLRSLIEQTAYHYQVPIGKVPSGPAGRFLTLPNDGRTGEFVYSDAVSTARESP